MVTSVLSGWRPPRVNVQATVAAAPQGEHTAGSGSRAAPLRGLRSGLAHRQPPQRAGVLLRLLLGDRPRRPLFAHRMPEGPPAAQDGGLQAAPVAGGRRGAGSSGLASSHGRCRRATQTASRASWPLGLRLRLRLPCWAEPGWPTGRGSGPRFAPTIAHPLTGAGHRSQQTHHCRKPSGPGMTAPHPVSLTPDYCPLCPWLCSLQGPRSDGLLNNPLFCDLGPNYTCFPLRIRCKPAVCVCICVLGSPIYRFLGV